MHTPMAPYEGAFSMIDQTCFTVTMLIHLDNVRKRDLCLASPVMYNHYADVIIW